MATPGQIRDLADRNVLPAAAVTALTALWPGSAVPSGGELGGLIDTAAEVLAACLDGSDRQLAA